MLFYKLDLVPMNLVNVIELKLEFEEKMISCVLLLYSIRIHIVPFGRTTRTHKADFFLDVRTMSSSYT